MQNILL